MARKSRRQFAVDDKVTILEEARQPQTTVAEVFRRHRSVRHDLLALVGRVPVPVSWTSGRPNHAALGYTC